MAPCSTSFTSHQQMRISDRDNIKLRKPIVEKKRRDRINSCIEQLKVILEKEFHKQEPNSKLEKADILEMTVSFLRQQLQMRLCHSNLKPGYLSCWKDSVQQQQELKLHQPSIQGSMSIQDSSKGPVWRPW
ncbi:hairy-related 12 [Gouania willdenowi]|uniref:hairy-related 12 n=1 Tax=Gouania willdenowi TaxID=441366 RepID=UPI001056DF73|nr:transcription factor HES-5-like [Gouania willdenowi]